MRDRPCPPYSPPNHERAAAARARADVERCDGCGASTGDLTDGYCAECDEWWSLWLDERADDAERAAAAVCGPF